MSHSKKISTLVVLSLMAGLASSAALADTTLTLQVNPHQVGGMLPGNTIIGHGQISTTDTHGGFQVRGTTEQDSTHPGTYIIRGKNDAQHQLRVRLEKQDWQTVGTQDKGIYTRTTEPSADFDIVTDGNQRVSGDEYTLSLEGAALK